MNVAGKSLQDIYDAGSKRLEQLENSQRGQLNEATDAHLEERTKTEPEALKQLETKSGELETEINSYLAHGLERIEKAVTGESEHTKQYIGRLVDALDLLAKRFAESITELREAADGQLSDLASDNQQLYKSASQAACSQTNHQGAMAVDGCRNEGTEAHADIVGKVDKTSSDFLEAEDEVVAELLSCYDTNADQLSTKFSDCSSRITQHLKANVSSVDSRAEQAAESIKNTIERLMETSDRFAFDSDVKLKERFSTLLQESTNSIDQTAAKSIDDLVRLHESSIADLSMKSQELSRDMDSVVETVTGNAGSTSADLQDKGKKLIGSYTDELNGRLESGRIFQGELEKERAEMVAEIWKELGEVRTKFEDKLANLAKTTLEKMKKICDESEQAIVTAQHGCISDSQKHANDRQSSIEKSASEFLQRVTQTRDSALQGILKAAGAGSDQDSGLPEQIHDDPSADGGNGSEKADGGDDSAKADGSSEKADASSEKADASSEKADASSEKADASSEKADAGSEKADEDNSDPNASGSESGSDARKRKRPGRNNDKRGEGKK
jgi:hypothetical protein